MINIRIAKARKCYDVESAFSVYITFDYDQRIVDTVKSLPQRFYNADKKEWEAPLPALKTVVDNVGFLVMSRVLVKLSKSLILQWLRSCRKVTNTVSLSAV